VTDDHFVEDRVRIRDMYDRFYWAFNSGDAEGARSFFAPGAQVVRRGAGDVITGDQSADGVTRAAQDPVASTFQHHVSNMVVDPDPDGNEDRRRVRIYFLVTGVLEPPEVTVRWSCRSEDIVERIDGRWVIAHREITLNHPDAN
jgi:hypothetical protein